MSDNSIITLNCYYLPTPNGTITDSDYGFRPDNYVDPAGCRTFGLKKHAVVKRFSASLVGDDFD